MKYICFSFDDAREDFYTKCLPILDRYNLKVSLNVIASTLLVINHSLEFDTCTLNQINEIYTKNNEIASHGYNHLVIQSSEDISKSLSIFKKVGIDIAGFVFPYNQHSDLVNSEMVRSQFSYCRVGDKPYTYKHNIAGYLKLILFHISFHYLFNYYHFYTHNIQNIGNINDREFLLHGVTIKKIYKEKTIERFIKHLKDNEYLIFIFHSIGSRKVDYSEGSWSVRKFNYLCKFLYNNRNQFKVLSVRELFKHD